MPVVMVFIAAFGLVTSLGITILSRAEMRVHDMYEQSFQSELIEWSRSLERYISYEYRAPASLSELTQHVGNEPLNSLGLDRISVASSEHNDVGLVYSKALIWHKRFDSNYADLDVLENNQVGSNNFSEQGDYKPPADVYWYQTSSISTLSNLRTTIYRTLDETVQRLVYSTNTLPVLMSSGTTLQVDDSIYLTDAVGYTGSFSSCAGLFEFDGAVITCSDLYAIDGSQVQYRILSDSQAAVYVESNNLRNAAGEPFIIFSHIMTTAE